ncbi:hypothetical protein [Caulobacter sp. 1776]|uniref:hypothetical protein n=1 Tax=Caulobacter sp. 1776 TaxID=3156420 RepID=UPI0033974A24
MLLPMSDTQTPARTWCETLQKKLMDAIDAAWAMAERSDDPAVIAKARDKARLAGQMAAEARKIAALVPPPRGEPRGDRGPARAAPPAVDVDVEAIAVEDVPHAAPARPPAAQAQAMRAALEKIGRRPPARGTKCRTPSA